MVEHSAVNRVVVGSSPTRGVNREHKRERRGRDISCRRDDGKNRERGSMVKRLRHRPFTAVTRVRFPLESLFKLNVYIIYAAQ